jgi:hypothetical protein
MGNRLKNLQMQYKKNIVFRAFLVILAIVLTGCASIPPQTIDLQVALMKETDRMHKVNKVLLKELYNVRRQQIEHLFINEYLPIAVQELANGISVDFPDAKDQVSKLIENTPPLLSAALEERNKMLDPLDKEFEKLNNALDDAFSLYKSGEGVLNDLLISAVKVKDEWDKFNAKLTDTHGIDIKGFSDKYESIFQSIGKTEIPFEELEKKMNKILK